ncbi:T9SS type A sorting domain-containing protein [Flavobacterium rhamnosiphilum]|uniref:T9SS type A sorting domain-containing protein n=1 Tax=Flavobacterium rhamnosiphilum TaxID=2541724 RepID=A0A4R5FBR7_9FLAO|nr:LamG-like jellyroll fold domain-containing protein [Flavobacterium rhamnosiphilum]TDE46573.1 T9SS type A sorting domain-containing protein [Flavobacterium rhamnosiphilum]
MKKTLLITLLLGMNLSYSQKGEEEKGDIKYELSHKNQAWFTGMKPGANYFQIKEKFDTYFGNHKWEESKPRELGESWIKENIFYLDKEGFVQSPPPFDALRANIGINNVFAATTTRNAGSWGLIGPVNSATTTYSGKGNHGGYVHLNRIDPTNPQKMFVSFLMGGLWVTSDGGTSWVLTDSNFPDEKYLDIDVCVSSPNTVYALSKKQLLKSTDGGLNWTSTTLTSTAYAGTAFDIAVSPSDPNTVVARWGDKIYRTTDGGTTWTSIVSGLPNYYIVGDCSVNSEMLDWSTTNAATVYFISTTNNNVSTVYRSTDSGLTFNILSTITLDPTANGQVIGWAKLLLPSNNATSIYIAIGTGANAYGHHAVQLYKLNATTGVQELKRVNMISGTFPNEIHHGDIAIDRNDENKLVFGSYSHKNNYYSTNNGVSFTKGATEQHSDLRSLDMVNNRVLVGSDGESVLSLDGGNTNTTITNSISNHELWGFGSAFKTNLVAGGANHGPVMIKEAGNGFEWYNGTGADQGNTDVNPLDDRYVYSQGYSNYRYFRTGVHTLINESNFLDLGGIYHYFNSIEFHPNYYYSMITHHAGQYPTGNASLATWKNSLIKTEDNGNSISIVKTFSSPVFREKICMTNPKYMYVIEGLTNNKLWRTSDGGITWINITPSLAASSSMANMSDIAVSDVDPNQVWITYSGVQSVCKVLKTSNADAAAPVWDNLTESILTSNPNTKIIFQRGSDGGVYVGNKSGIYYKNNTMPNWVMLGNGLPQTDVRFMFINYNENKLKIGTSRGAFEHGLYEISSPKAQISASTSKVSCSQVEKVQFKDYSTVRNASASWSWSFPGGTPATSTLENPEVSYANAPNGKYDATLTVTDAYGTDTQTITGIVEVLNQCGSSAAEPIPGKAANLKGATGQDYLKLSNLSLNKNALTFSCWIKPNGIQTDYSAVFMSQDANSAFGMNFLGGNNTVGFHPNWSWNSGLIVPANQWSHVALVSDETSVTIYVNGVASSTAATIPSDVITDLFMGTYGRGYNNRVANFEIDEVCFWNRALSTDEIRKWRHLTKSTAGDPILTGLVAYYQFNEEVGSLSLNKVGSDFLTYKGSTYSHDSSTAPVFGGLSEKITVTSSGEKNFSTTGLSMTFPNNSLPNGDIWVSKATLNPDVLPDALSNFNTYWAVDNYGAGQTFGAITELTFTDNAFNSSSAGASTYKLFKRNSNDFGATWGTALDTGDSRSGSGTSAAITFSTGLSLTSLGQLILSQDATTLSVKGNQIKANEMPTVHPNPLKSNTPLKIAVPAVWKNSTLFVYDSMGRLIINATLKEGENELLLNVSTGIYYLNIISPNDTFSTKLLVE